MNKDTPGPARLAVMALFALSCFCILLFLWISFGGAIPLKPQGYRFEVAFPEAATLANEADVRISGINVGKVKEQELMKDPPRTLTTIELDERFAPIPRDVRATLRQKTLLGETYVELTPGSDSAPKLDDGGRLALAQVEETTELDEIFQAFDRPTREAFQSWIRNSAGSIDRGSSESLNAALGNLPFFVEDATDVLEVLDEREEALGDFVRNTGVVFEAINERDGALRELIVNSHRVFEATASRDDALAETIETFPGFLEESRRTLARLEVFSRETRPLVQDLTPVAEDLGPTVRDLGDLSPDLVNLFGDLDALIRVAPRTLPEASKILRGAEPVVEAIHQFAPELNPILSYAFFQAPQVADFITVGAAATAGKLPSRPGEGHPRHYLRQIGIINGRSLALNRERPSYERGNAYLAPNAWLRWRPLGILESTDCRPAGGRKPNPSEGEPPCFPVPPMQWDGRIFPNVDSGKAPVTEPPEGNEGTRPPGR